MPSRVVALQHTDWRAAVDETMADTAASALERGDVVCCPQLRFAVEPDERTLFTPTILGTAKNASYDPAADRLGGTTVAGSDRDILRAFILRFSEASLACAERLLPFYRGQIVRGRASFRPAEIAGRQTSWRHDDTRLHVDSFPATPSGGRRILRLFTNVNPDGRARSWRIGDDFEAVAQRFTGRLRLPVAGSAMLLALIRVTKSRRSAYDALMLQLHDLMKKDDEFQTRSPQSSVDFPAGSTWIAFTDQVSHAATAGQYQLEQTFLLPVAAMREPERAPLRVLERLKRRRLA